jgi:hypothetical protein
MIHLDFISLYTLFNFNILALLSLHVYNPDPTPLYILLNLLVLLSLLIYNPDPTRPLLYFIVLIMYEYRNSHPATGNSTKASKCGSQNPTPPHPLRPQLLRNPLPHLLPTRPRLRLRMRMPMQPRRVCSPTTMSCSLIRSAGPAFGRVLRVWAI